jgi:hypothetical protein
MRATAEVIALRLMAQIDDPLAGKLVGGRPLFRKLREGRGFSTR